MTLIKHTRKVLIICFFSFLILLSSFIQLYADEIDWLEVARTDNEVHFIDAHSIKYNNQGLLSVITKYSEINPVDQMTLNSNSYLLVVDCESRLFSKLPVNGEIKQVKVWNESINDKLMKKTILNSCLY